MSITCEHTCISYLTISCWMVSLPVCVSVLKEGTSLHFVAKNHFAMQCLWTTYLVSTHVFPSEMMMTLTLPGSLLPPPITP